MTPKLLNEAFSANKITIIIYKRVFRAAVEHVRKLTYISGSRCTWWQKLRTGTHTHTHALRGTTTVTTIIIIINYSKR